MRPKAAGARRIRDEAPSGIRAAPTQAMPGGGDEALRIVSLAMYSSQADTRLWYKGSVQRHLAAREVPSVSPIRNSGRLATEFLRDTSWADGNFD